LYYRIIYNVNKINKGVKTMNKKVEICANCGGELVYPFYPGLPTLDSKQFCSIQCAEEQGYKWSNYLDRLLTSEELGEA
jgi:hypothetical protein